MVINWNYSKQNYEEAAKQTMLIPEGKYRVRIEDTQHLVSQSGKDMLKLVLKVSGFNQTLWYFLVFDDKDEDARKRTDYYLGRFYDAFNIPHGELDTFDWVGKTGGARIVIEQNKDGNNRSVIKAFLSRKEIDALPAWHEGSDGNSSSSKENSSGIPF